MSQDTYRPWDRAEKLGEPPWKHDDPKVIAWQKAHGHDARLKCYPELGCVLVEEHLEQEVDQLCKLGERLVEAARVAAPRLANDGVWNRLTAAIAAWDEHMHDRFEDALR